VLILPSTRNCTEKKKLSYSLSGKKAYDSMPQMETTQHPKKEGGDLLTLDEGVKGKPPTELKSPRKPTPQRRRNTSA